MVVGGEPGLDPEAPPLPAPLVPNWSAVSVVPEPDCPPGSNHLRSMASTVHVPGVVDDPKR